MLNTHRSSHYTSSFLSTPLTSVEVKQRQLKDLRMSYTELGNTFVPRSLSAYRLYVMPQLIRAERCEKGGSVGGNLDSDKPIAIAILLERTR